MVRPEWLTEHQRAVLLAIPSSGFRTAADIALNLGLPAFKVAAYCRRLRSLKLIVGSWTTVFKIDTDRRVLSYGLTADGICLVGELRRRCEGKME